MALSTTEPEVTPKAAVPSRRPAWPSVALALIRTGPALMLIAVVGAASLLSPVFFTTRNLGNVLAQTAVIAVLAIAQLLVIVTRGIDLSVGSTIALAAVVGALTFEAVQSTPLVLLAMLGTGLAVGLVNGTGLVWVRQPHRGMPELVQTIGGGSIGWLPYSTFLVLALALAVLFLTTRVVWGRWIYAVGGNPDAARRSAIPVNGVLISVYALSGLFAGIAAIITSGRLNAGSPTFGELAELDAIAAVVIGGASFLGGRGTVGNALVGAFMIGVIRNAMNLLNVDAFIQPIVIGTVILVAVELDVIRGAMERRFRVMRAAQS